MRRMTVTVAVLALGLTACGGGGGDAGTWSERMALVPDVAGSGTLTLVDLEAAGELAGTDPTTFEGAFELLLPDREVGVPLPETLGGNRLGDEGEFAEVNGYDLTQVDWLVEVASPPLQVAVAGGRFVTDALDAANEPSGDGTWNTDLDPSATDLEAAAPGRPIGRTPHLRLDDDRLTVVAGTTLDALDDGVRAHPLADHQAVASVAAALDALDAFGAVVVFTGTVEGAGDGGGFGDAAVLADLPIRAVGVAFVPDERRFAVLHGFGDEEAAADGANAIERLLAEELDPVTGAPYTDRYGDVEVEVVASASVARLDVPEDTPWGMPLNDLLRGAFGHPG
ncbi:hypothetical protein FTX61_08115 [Nitriliruptoraceae bacterium ZYF776]|nr:hypothetical protein [Profundirhabdus halotolerans]